MLLDEVVFLGGSRAIVGPPLFADKEVFEVGVFELILLHSLAVEVLNF